jgi:hypothetical protein
VSPPLTILGPVPGRRTRVAGEPPGSGTGPPIVPDPGDLAAARAERWWWTRRPIRSLDRAAEFLDDVGFALLFGTERIALPTLYHAAADRPVLDLGTEWGPVAERVWGWKDELPLGGRAWYGRFLRGRASFLAPDLLADLYPRQGHPEDALDAGLSPDAAKVVRILLRSGPQTTVVLREALDAVGSGGGARFEASVRELGRALVVTTLGTRDEGPGWPSAVLELTSRAFRIPRRRPSEAERRRRAAGRFLDTVLSARPYELGNAFGWRAGPAREVLESLVDSEEAVRVGPAYVLPSLTG